MGNPVVVNTSLAAAVANGIAQSQSLGAAGNVNMNGSLVSGGVATLAPLGTERQVIVTSASNDTGILFTVTGTNSSGAPIADTFAGASGGAATSSLYFRTVTAVYANGATAGNITVGTNTVGASRPINIDYFLNPVNVTVSIKVSGTVNYTVQYTLDDLQTLPTWVDDPNLVTQTINGITSFAMPICGIRTKINSGTGTVQTTMVQSGLG